MSKNKGKLIGKTFESVNYTDWQTLISVNGQDRRIHFSNGIDQRENGFIGGKYHTTDPDVIKSLENHPHFGSTTSYCMALMHHLNPNAPPKHYTVSAYSILNE